MKYCTLAYIFLDKNEVYLILKANRHKCCKQWCSFDSTHSFNNSVIIADRGIINILKYL